LPLSLPTLLSHGIIACWQGQAECQRHLGLWAPYAETCFWLSSSLSTLDAGKRTYFAEELQSVAKHSLDVINCAADKVLHVAALTSCEGNDIEPPEAGKETTTTLRLAST